MRVYINRYHKFLEDYDNRLDKAFGHNRLNLRHEQHLQLIKEWYSYDVVVDDLGMEAYVEMSDQNYTLFAIKYS